jgi:hypothetical protein
MTIVAQHKGIMVIHAENDAIITYMREAEAEGRVGAENIHLVHNNLSEDIEFRKVIRLAELSGLPSIFFMCLQRGLQRSSKLVPRVAHLWGDAPLLRRLHENYKEPDGSVPHLPFSQVSGRQEASGWRCSMAGCRS